MLEKQNRTKEKFICSLNQMIFNVIIILMTAPYNFFTNNVATK
jgi:hypothetical protein